MKTLGARERDGEGRGIPHLGDGDLAALGGPRPAFFGAADDGADGLAGSEKIAGQRSADLAGYSGNGIHIRLLGFMVAGHRPRAFRRPMAHSPTACILTEVRFRPHIIALKSTMQGYQCLSTAASFRG
jgi:hypothetical protein